MHFRHLHSKLFSQIKWSVAFGFATSEFCRISPGLVCLCWNWGLSTHAISYPRLPITLGDEAETQAKDPLLGTDADVSGDVSKGGFFHADRLLWIGPWSNGLQPLGYCRMCGLFSISKYMSIDFFWFCFGWVCNSISFGWITLLTLIFWFTGYLYL